MQFHREVAVAVADGPDPDQVADREPGLLLELASGRRFRTFSRLDPAARKLPETR